MSPRMSASGTCGSSSRATSRSRSMRRRRPVTSTRCSATTTAATQRSRRAAPACSRSRLASEPAGSTSSGRVTELSALAFERSRQDRVLAGVCGGLAARLGVDATLVRLVFALLALAGGAGIVAYLALWVYDDGRRLWPAVVLLAVSVAMLLGALGLSHGSTLGATLMLVGLVVILVRGGSIRAGGTLPVLGVVLASAGAVIFLSRHGASGPLIAPGAVVGALVLVIGPWIWQLTSERTERIRLEERAEIAARIHDSVLQTLALVQRHADEPTRVAAIARRQERELRRWLYGSGVGEAASLGDALADAAADVEELHGVRIELATAGEAPLDDPVGQLV